MDDATATWMALGDGRKEVEANEEEARVVQRRALRWTAPYAAGTLIDHDLEAPMIIATRPCPEGALEPWMLEDLIGARLARDVEADTLVTLEDLAS